MAEPQTRAAGIALSLGMLSGIHNKLHELRKDASEDDDRDIDSAQVFLEGAYDKLNAVLARQTSGETPTQTIDEPFIEKKYEEH